MSATSHPPTEVLFAFLQGRLSGAEADAVEAHLAGCSACAVGPLPPDDGLICLARQAGQGQAALSPGPQTPRDDAQSNTPQPTDADAARAPNGEPAPGVRPGPAAGDNVPGYEVEGELGHGGMGVVYKARQLKLKRTVALKMILDGRYASAEEVARFRAEAEAVARLNHPNIVQLFEVGEHNGLPFLCLEFCTGGSLAKKLSGTPLPARQAARLAETVARAVEAAHQAHVLHRDLKPGNVLLAEDGVPKVADFGLAKFLDPGATGMTRSDAIVGTPSYMAPEQARGNPNGVGPAADVYALGAILYECLTGRPPFKAANPLDTVLQVLAEDPVPPRQLNANVPADLETVCLKSLHKDPSRRYTTAAELGDDLRRWQQGEPVRARPVSAIERAVKWARRRPAVAVLVAAVLVLAAVAWGLVVWALMEANTAREEKQRADEKTAVAVKQKELADDRRDRVELALYASKLAQAQRHGQDKDLQRALELLGECQWDLRGPEFRLLWTRFNDPQQQTLKGHTEAVSSVAFSPDGRRIASASQDSTVKLWDARTGQQLLSLKGHTGPVTGVAFSPDGRRIATSSWDRTVKVWDTDKGQEIRSLNGHTDRVYCVAVSADGKRIASGSADRTLKVWDLDTGQQTRFLEGHRGDVSSVAFSSDGKASGTSKSTRRGWSVPGLLRRLRRSLTEG